MVVLDNLLAHFPVSSSDSLNLPDGSSSHVISSHAGGHTSSHRLSSNSFFRDDVFSIESKIGDDIDSDRSLSRKITSGVDSVSIFHSKLIDSDGSFSVDSSSSSSSSSSIVSSKISSSSVVRTPSLMSLFGAELPAPPLPDSLQFTGSPIPTTFSSPSFTESFSSQPPPQNVHSFSPFDETSSWSAEQICGVIVVAVIVPFILASNLLVIASVLKFKRLQMPTNYFIVSLAAVDVFVALVTPFVIAVEVLPGQVSELMLCLAPNRILMTACGVSLLTLAAIAYDRHTALVSPLKYVSVMTMRRITLLIVLTWLYSATIVWAPLPLGWYSDPNLDKIEVEDFHSGTDSAKNNLDKNSLDAVTRESRVGGAPQNVEKQPQQLHQHCSFMLLHDNAHILFLSAIFGPACVAITVCYFRIYTVARHHARAIAAVESSVHHNLRMRFMLKDAKYAKTLALVIGVFLVLWMPYLVCLLAEVMTDAQVSPWMWNYLTLLAVLNSGLNPWIYAYKNNEFRAAFRKIFRSCCDVGILTACKGNKDSRRSSAMSDVNTITTTNALKAAMSPTTASTLTRSRQGSGPPGRLSDVSCVLSVGPDERFDSFSRQTLYSSAIVPNGAITDEYKVCLERETATTNPSCGVLCPRRTSTFGCLRTLVPADERYEVDAITLDCSRDCSNKDSSNRDSSNRDCRNKDCGNKDFQNKDCRNSDTLISSINCSSNCDKFFHRRTSLVGEMCRTNLVSGDSKAYIADLLSLYLHHSLLEAQSSITDSEPEHEHGDGHSDHSDGSLDTVTTHDSEMTVERSS